MTFILVLKQPHQPPYAPPPVDEWSSTKHALSRPIWCQFECDQRRWIGLYETPKTTIRVVQGNVVGPREKSV